MTQQPAPARELSVTLPETLYPKDAIYAAAYVYLDVCYVHLAVPEAGRVTVTFRERPNREAIDVAGMMGDFCNEVLARAWRGLVVDDNRALIEMISTRAVAGAAGPPGLDDLLALETSDATAFEDPLGIAMSWEEKYKKKAPENAGA